MNPTPSQQTTLVSAIYAHITRPPCDPTVYTYRGVRVVVKRYLENGYAHIQTYNYEKTLPQAGIGGTTSFVSDKLVPRGSW